MKKVIAKVNLYENGAFIKKGSEFFVDPKRLKALGKLVKVAKETEEIKETQEKTIEKPEKDKMVHRAKKK